MAKTSQSLSQAFNAFKKSLEMVYPEQEAKSLSYYVFEEVFGYNKTQVILHAQQMVPASYFEQVDFILNELLDKKPPQYIFSKAHFFNLEFFVDKSVLIPRPETEELIIWMEQEIKALGLEKGKFVDLGTGSGCIPICFKLLFDKWEVLAIDNSQPALNVAQKNAKKHKQEIEFLKVDLLRDTKLPIEKNVDVFCSNPPYIRFSEKEQMLDNVLKYEPHEALFVSDSDPLIFYRTIIDLFLKYKNKKAFLFFEINEGLKEELAKLVDSFGLKDYEFKKDINDKWRMLKIQTE